MTRPVTVGSPPAEYPVLFIAMARHRFFYGMVGSWSSAAEAGNDLSKVDIYDPETGIWSAGADLQQERACHTATVLLDGRVVVAGGIKWWDNWRNPDNYRNSVEIYDPAADQWEEGPALNFPAADHTCTLLENGRLFVAGGRTSTCLDSTEIDDNGRRLGIIFSFFWKRDDQSGRK